MARGVVELAIPHARATGPVPRRFLGAGCQPEDELGVWGLHVRIWRDNPEGMVAESNPRVSYRAGAGVERRAMNVPSPFAGGPSHFSPGRELEAEPRRHLTELGRTGRIASALEAHLGRIDLRLGDLGRMLWFGPIGELNDDHTCAGCHSPTHGPGDTRPTAIGVDNNLVVGPGGTGLRNQRRSPMVIDSAVAPGLLALGPAAVMLAGNGAPPPSCGLNLLASKRWSAHRVAVGHHGTSLRPRGLPMPSLSRRLPELRRPGIVRVAALGTSGATSSSR